MVNFLSLLWHLLKLFFGFIFISFLSVSGPVRAEKGPLFMRGCLSAVFLCQCWAGRRSARAFGVWPPFPPPHLTLSHTGLLVTRAACCYQIGIGTKNQIGGRPHHLPLGKRRFCHVFCGPKTDICVVKIRLQSDIFDRFYVTFCPPRLTKGLFFGFI